MSFRLTIDLVWRSRWKFQSERTLMGRHCRYAYMNATLGLVINFIRMNAFESAIQTQMLKHRQSIEQDYQKTHKTKSFLERECRHLLLRPMELNGVPITWSVVQQKGAVPWQKKTKTDCHTIVHVTETVKNEMAFQLIGVYSKMSSITDTKIKNWLPHARTHHHKQSKVRQVYINGRNPVVSSAYGIRLRSAHGKLEKHKAIPLCWGHTPKLSRTFGISVRMEWPLTRASPDVGPKRPVIIEMVVVLPAYAKVQECSGKGEVQNSIRISDILTVFLIN